MNLASYITKSMSSAHSFIVSNRVRDKAEVTLSACGSASAGERVLSGARTPFERWLLEIKK